MPGALSIRTQLQGHAARGIGGRGIPNVDKAGRTSRDELGIDPSRLGGSAWEAAGVSFLLFMAGAFIPVVPYFFLSGATAVIVSAAANSTTGSLKLERITNLLAQCGVTRTPRGDQAGERDLRPGVSNFRGDAPSRSVMYRARAPSRSEENTRCLPSGDHCGFSFEPPVTARVAPVPSGWQNHTSNPVSVRETNAIRSPFGDQDGESV